jgi:hypothetical protein
MMVQHTTNLHSQAGQPAQTAIMQQVIRGAQHALNHKGRMQLQKQH